MASAVSADLVAERFTGSLESALERHLKANQITTHLIAIRTATGVTVTPWEGKPARLDAHLRDEYGIDTGCLLRGQRYAVAWIGDGGEGQLNVKGNAERIKLMLMSNFHGFLRAVSDESVDY